MAKKSQYQVYRERAEALEVQLRAINNGRDLHDDTIQYLLESAECFIRSARILVEIRLKETTDEPAPNETEV